MARAPLSTQAPLHPLSPPRPFRPLRRPLMEATAVLRERGKGGWGRYVGDVLADLLDFAGTVSLAQALGASPVQGACDASAALSVAAHAERELASAEGAARQPLRDPRTRGPLLSPERVEEELSASAAITTRKRKAIDAAARSLWVPLAEATSSRIEHVRHIVAAIRDEL